MQNFINQLGLITNSDIKSKGFLNRVLRKLTKADAPAKLILHNDPLNGGHWVRDRLMDVCELDRPEALSLMMEAHNQGQSVILESTKERCDQIAQDLRNAGADKRFFKDAKPLIVTVELT